MKCVKHINVLVAHAGTHVVCLFVCLFVCCCLGRECLTCRSGRCGVGVDCLVGGGLVSICLKNWGWVGECVLSLYVYFFKFLDCPNCSVVKIP